MTWPRASSLAVVALLAACGGSGGDVDGAGAPGDPIGLAAEPANAADLDAAAQRGADYLLAHLAEIDWANLAVVDLLSRGWDVEELAAARPLAQQVAADGSAGGEWPGLGRLFVADHPTPSPLEDLLAATLYCDRVPLTAEQQDELLGLDEQGGYVATHLGLAAGWMGELGCPGAEELAAAASEHVAADLEGFVAAIEAADGGVPDEPWLTDLALEQIAVLGYLGDEAVAARWAPHVLDQQRSDGGWLMVGTGDDSTSATHPSILATWVLLQATGPGSGAPLVVLR